MKSCSQFSLKTFYYNFYLFCEIHFMLAVSNIPPKTVEIEMLFSNNVLKQIRNILKEV